MTPMMPFRTSSGSRDSLRDATPRSIYGTTRSTDVFAWTGKTREECGYAANKAAQPTDQVRAGPPVLSFFRRTQTNGVSSERHPQKPSRGPDFRTDDFTRD